VTSKKDFIRKTWQIVSTHPSFPCIEVTYILWMNLLMRPLIIKKESSFLKISEDMNTFNIRLFVSLAVTLTIIATGTVYNL